MPRVVDDEYYKEVWGFDPATERDLLSAGKFRYCTAFALTEDPGFFATGVTIAAEVTYSRRGGVKNFIVFKRGDKEARVHCTHTVIYSGSLDSALTLAEDGVLREVTSAEEDAHLTRLGTAILSPEEHFVALRSYVAALAEAGIGHLLGLGSPPEWEGWRGDLGLSQPFGFNSAMRTQIVAALREVAPEATRALLRDTFAELATIAGPAWVTPRLNLLDGLYFHALMRESLDPRFIWKAGLSAPFAEFLTEEPAFFELFYEALPQLRLLRLAVLWPNTPEEVLDYLAEMAPPEQWTAPQFVSSEEMQDALELRGGEEWEIRRRQRLPKDEMGTQAIQNWKYMQVAGTSRELFARQATTTGFRAISHPHCTPKLLGVLASHPAPEIRAYVAFHPAASRAMLECLGKDEDAFVRLAVAACIRTPANVLSALAEDLDEEVRSLIATRAVNSP